MADDFQLDPGLLAWLEKTLPEIGSVGRVRFRLVRRLPLWWVPGGVSGLTLWNRVYLAPAARPMDSSAPAFLALVFHELIHVLQFRRNPIRFPFRYLWHHLRFGYWNNPAEVEARQESQRLVRLYLQQSGAAGNSVRIAE
jgi:hypothetical protein